VKSQSQIIQSVLENGERLSNSIPVADQGDVINVAEISLPAIFANILHPVPVGRGYPGDGEHRASMYAPMCLISGFGVLVDELSPSAR